MSLRAAEDAVDAGRIVDRARPHPRGAGQLPGSRAGDLRQPFGHQIGAHGLAGESGDAFEQPVVDPVGRGDRQPGDRLDGAEALRGERGDPFLARGVTQMPEVLHHGARVDADGAGELARGVARAGVHGVVAVGVEQSRLHR